MPSYLDIVLCDLDLRCVDVVNKFSQGLTVHLSDLHLMGLALAHISCTQRNTVKGINAHTYKYQTGCQANNSVCVPVNMAQK